VVSRFNRNVDDIARFLVQLGERARSKDNIANEFDGKGRALTVATALDARRREYVIKPELQPFVNGADHAADVADILVCGACADALEETGVRPPRA
jgi:hypothetical protein